MVSLVRVGRKLQRPGMPETERMVAVSERSQPIGEFLEWLGLQQGYLLARFADDEEGELIAEPMRIERLLAQYFGIDLDRMDRERHRLLVWMNKKRGDA